jgi:hypothetical protein
LARRRFNETARRIQALTLPPGRTEQKNSFAGFCFVPIASWGHEIDSLDAQRDPDQSH